MVHLLLGVIYLAFISLGLPDSLLGSAWPSIYGELGVPVSFAGVISMIISAGTIVSSLGSDRLTRALGPGRVTACSVALTAAALFGFSTSTSFWMLCLWAVPYGLGAGSVDAALNNYVAIHYASRHMSWLHCMWGVGTLVGPNLISYALSGGQGWQMGYRYISLMQVVLTAVLIFSLPLWKRQPGAAGQQEDGQAQEALSLGQTLRIPGAKNAMVAFFCYCAVEQTAGLWAGSYLVLHSGLSAERAAQLVSLFYIGITVGRAACGFITTALGDVRMVRLGQGIILAGVVAMLLPSGWAAQAGLVLIGLGCAPIYPSMIHATPARFGASHSQAVIGLQMASAYVGTCLMPPLFGLVAQNITISLMPLYLLAILVLMTVMNEGANRAASRQSVLRAARQRAS